MHVHGSRGRSVAPAWAVHAAVMPEAGAEKPVPAPAQPGPAASSRLGGGLQRPREVQLREVCNRVQADHCPAAGYATHCVLVAIKGAEQVMPLGGAFRVGWQLCMQCTDQQAQHTLSFLSTQQWRANVLACRQQAVLQEMLKSRADLPA